MYLTTFEELMKNSQVAGPASEEQVKSAEVRLSARFPSGYRFFLLKYGAVVGTGFSIVGVFTDEESTTPFWEDVVESTEAFRESTGDEFPQTLIPIAGDGVGVSYYIDCSEANDNAVVAYGPGVDGIRVAGSFEEFAVKLAQDELVHSGA